MSPTVPPTSIMATSAPSAPRFTCAGRTARAGEAGTVVTIATTKQQKSIGGLTSRAGVTPKFVGVTPLSTELMKITGAQEPSGVPYIVPIVEKSVRSGGNKRPRPNSSQRRRRPH